MARQRILDAAATLAEEEGAPGLSLERVAERAGVSKGGLLYHFHTKEALLSGMIESLIECHDVDVEERVQAGKGRPEAVLDHCLETVGGRANLMSAFIAAVATDRSARDIVRDRRQRWKEELIASGMGRAEATVMCLALDGLFVGTSLGITEMNEQDRADFRQGIARLLGPTEKECLASWFEQALAQVDEPVPA